jgi:hypothetical protein
MYTWLNQEWTDMHKYWFHKQSVILQVQQHIIFKASLIALWDKYCEMTENIFFCVLSHFLPWDGNTFLAFININMLENDMWLQCKY